MKALTDPLFAKFTLLMSCLCLPAAHADESTLRLDPIVFNGKASFESLGEDSEMPKQTTPVSPARSSTLKSLADDQVFAPKNLGFPGGATGIGLGGRTVEDTQVSTLGVPLNLPQGGGADLSMFPSFLWSSADFAPTPISSGFVPTSASASINLKLWTREEITRTRRDDDPASRLTLSYDRQVQSFSLANSRSTIAINAGMNFGLQSGPAGSLSYEFYRDSRSTYRLHFLGTNQTGSSPGSLSYPTPGATLQNWRVIPILEAQNALGDEWIWESTVFGDSGGLNFNHSNGGFSSASTSQQYGMENALLYQDYTFAFSARYEHYQQGSSIVADEWPLLLSVTRAFQPSSDLEVKTTGLANAINTLGVAPGARLSAQWSNGVPLQSARGHYFAEAFTTGKQPTLTARYYQLPPGFVGNPNLQPERIYSLILGRQEQFERLTSKTSLKGELRNAVQISSGNTVINAGGARLLYLDQEVTWQALERLTLTPHLLFTVSHLDDFGTPYPDLSPVAAKLRATYLFLYWFELEGRATYQGPSIASQPVPAAFHPNYDLYDVEARFKLSKDLTLQAGIENLTDNPAQVVLDYPLPGRMAYLGFQARI